jgi:hypothetical protein
MAPAAPPSSPTLGIDSRLGSVSANDLLWLFFSPLGSISGAFKPVLPRAFIDFHFVSNFN